MKDMLFLRSFMVCGGICGITFNMLQPTPMYIPSMWGCVFLLINLTQIGILLLERREVEFSSDELDVFELEFQRHGVTACQFKKLMRYAEAEWRELPTDHVILKQGDQVDDIYLIISGCAEVTVNGGAVGQVQRGSLVGETALLAKGHLAGATVTTLVPTKVVVWDKHKLRQVLANDPSLILSVSATINSDLATKLAKRNLSKDRSLETYKDVLGGICSAGRVSPEEKKALREFRQRHGIRPSEHEAAVREIGWTLDEYDDGAKHHSGRLAGLLSRVPRWTGRRKALQTMEQSPHPADVPVLKQETQPQLEPQTPHFNREKLPPGKGLKGEAASLQNLSPLAVCLDDKVKAKMTDRKKDVEAVLGARETQLLYATLEVPEDERGAIDLNFS
ncbi:hypothetical protein KFL_003650040 [Klebsormidium nitens]|uniref:Cyclic nucleotide-binding domain-containing protein n=1 Tax=Klebsormidium nitens TaxID=105231 RepID=A0A1Y1IAL6_KLENI|nr:hypothetical protein KFL_003650040 [Klebsormidium nitens]|eukprot:GAQ87613.1 hypothetical protein KFL_003650040 [Klebsormidium nitens]